MHNKSADAIIEDYPGLEREDIQACIAYVHAVIANQSVDEVSVEPA
jgi:uncharacterized protein (DUF433 family)